jgi:diketogulonate reductase-like aldo/keto reductase
MSTRVMPSTHLPSGEVVPKLGQGTWHMAEDRRRREEEIAALRLGLDLGMTVIDTAEMYAEGDAELLVGEAIEDRRDEAFLVDKVMPHHATRRGTVAACEGSLQRLRAYVIDLYLLHWRGSVPLRETLDGFDELLLAGRIRHWGVSNFDVSDMEELVGLPGGDRVATNQVLYNLARRGIEYDLLPWCRHRGIPIMAYSPIEQGRILDDPAVQAIAERHDATPAQVALAWVLRHDGVITVPKSGDPRHVEQNRAAADLRLTKRDLVELDRAFPSPTHKVPLEMI